MKSFTNILAILSILLLSSCSKKDEITNPETQNDNTPFIFVEAGSFRMGDSSLSSNSKPVHKVNLSGYYIGQYEVTQAEWNKLMSFNFSMQKGDKLPVSRILWLDAIEYCNKRSQSEGLTPCYTITSTGVTCNFKANGYRLPTEAEWEYAARGGKFSHNYKLSGSNDPGEVAWYHDNSGGLIHEVGTKKPNELGIYDMSGNVMEWCWDVSRPYEASETSDPAGPAVQLGSPDPILGLPAEPYWHIVRGGDYKYNSNYLPAASRSSASPSDYFYQVGLRLVKR